MHPASPHRKSGYTPLILLWLSALYCLLSGVVGLRAQSSYALSVGGYMQTTIGTAPASYDAGYSFYSAAWPLVGDYPRNNYFQSGLYGTWMFPQTGLVSGAPYTDIEGGLGWWNDRKFQTATPKFSMGGVAYGPAVFSDWVYANGPGVGTARGNGKYGVAQLSPTLLFPPDGLNLRQGTSGQLFGYGYLSLPLTQPKTTTAGAAVPTGNHNWTLFLNTRNFKGPVAFFTPYFWSQITVDNPQWAGEMLDSRWAKPNKSVAMETPRTIRTQGIDTADGTFSRSIPVYYPVDENGYSQLMHRLSVYDQSALWNDVGDWLHNNGPAPSGVIDPGSTFVQGAAGNNPVWTMYNVGTDTGKLNWGSLVVPLSANPQDMGYQWQIDQMTVIPSENGALVQLPEYHQGPLSATSASKWYPSGAADVPEPAATTLAAANFSNSISRSSVVAKDNDPAWTSPGPMAGPFRALLGDGSVVTYYWYRFADQPALQKADLTAAEREQMQLAAEKIHREWKNDRDYLAPPTSGTLADVDTGQLVVPPLGLEVGYVPIAWQQDWGGSVANPGALKFTSVSASPVAGQPFSVTVRAENTSGAAQNVTSNTLVQLSVASGNGGLSGTTVGTIPSGSSSVTITGVIYSAAESMTLKASATCLSSATSSTITLANPAGKINIYNRPATGVATDQAVLNATLGCPGTDAAVSVHWGTTNGGNNAALWANSASLGTWNHVTSMNISHAATGLAPSTKYYYIFRGTNASGTTWASQVSSFTTLPLAPVITAHPVGKSHVIGAPASFTVTATDATQYQWYKGAVALADGGNVSGANTATLRLSAISEGDAGSYSVVVGNVSGSATSNPASLTIVSAQTLTWDANTVSANAQDGAGTWTGNNWHSGSANVDWNDYHNALIGSGGTGGVITPGTVAVNDLTFNNFTGTYTLDTGTLTVTGDLIYNSSGAAKLSAVIAGTGMLTKNGTGTLTMDGVTNNTYSGGTIVNSGTLVWGTMVGSVSPLCSFACGTGPVTLNSGAQIDFERASPTNRLTLNGGTLRSKNGWGATWTGAVTVNSTTTLRADNGFEILGSISGSGGFIKTGTSTLTFSGVNTYTGATTVQTGKIVYPRKASMGPGPITINAGAVVDLNFTGTRLLESLTLGGVVQPVGTYGSVNSNATYKSSYFGGTGTITVTNYYAVSYNGNGHTGGTAPSAQTKTYNVDLTLATNSGSLTRTGYVFDGWNTESDGSGTNYGAGATYTPNASVVLYAKWVQETTPPALVATNPANGASGITIHQNLIMTFNEPIAFDSGLITLRKTSDNSVVESYDVANPSGNLSLNGTTLTINPTVDLTYATGYYVTIDTTAIKDLVGNAFAGISTNGTWNFTTISLSQLLFYDDFDPTGANASLTDPAARATGTLAATVKYVWLSTSTTGVVIDGTLNWDNNNSRNTNNEQTDATGTQNIRMNFNWYSTVANKIWEVEFDQRVGWSHPLTFGLSDSSQNGHWNAWDDANYDFAVGAYGSSLRYDTDNEGGANGLARSGVFPTTPSTTDMHHFRIRFDEPNNRVRVWINEVMMAETTALDFENTGRYLSWGEGANYAGALDNLLVKLINGNSAPVFAANPITGSNATEGMAYSGNLAGSATDVDGDSLTYAKVSGPAWLGVASNGTLSGTPTGLNLGNNTFTVSVTDGLSPAVEVTLNVTVRNRFQTWSAGATTFNGDANADGIADGMAWLLGAANSAENGIARLPDSQRENDGALTLSFLCLNAANRGAATLQLQFSRDMGASDPWTSHQVAIPTTSGTDATTGVVFAITPNGNYDDVVATIPATAAGTSGRLFVRLMAAESP